MDSLFSSLFPATDQTAWQTQVQKELKSEGAYDTLRWHTDEGFTLEPYYTADSLTDLPLTTTQEAQKQTPGWLNAPERVISNEKTDNINLRDTLIHGADALVITLPKEPHLMQLLNGIKLSEAPVFFRFNAQTTGINGAELVRKLKAVAPYQLKGGLLADTDDSTAEATRLTADSPQFRTICSSSHIFHNAGATAIQELAFMLASLADSYDRLTNEGLTIDQLVPKTSLSVSIGTSYFLEIAKLRALRVLFSRFISHYSLAISHYSLSIHAQTSTFYDSTATIYTNLLRATTEAMAAVIGGCDVLTIHPYNAILGQSGVEADPFAERMARNVSLLLKDESYLDRVADPSAGSYYIENLTQKLTEAAWVLFLNVEKQGGFSKALATGFIADEINRSYQAKVEAVRRGKVLVGVTKFRFDESTPQLHKAAKILTGLLPDRRLAQGFE
ncbi:methylmalonyl-CoA mutase [Spirosoma sp. HMF4905]|uniref:Methylmalonyl-CoA mutase n=1 Tax=Spirosoma arboris TaxID=2682092 RepID=A0A7K1SBJ4_9BACT|nr:methylmalonyl-CoA mutase family protein [Spirosoma arboris]MVM31038.1 methylmalonyl-CoA mutase [Spirosoma arboris]